MKNQMKICKPTCLCHRSFSFFSPVEEAGSHCLTNVSFSLEMLEETSRLYLAPEPNTLESFGLLSASNPTNFRSAPTPNLWFLSPKAILSYSNVSKLLQQCLKRFQLKLQQWKPALGFTLTIFFSRLFKFHIIPHPVLTMLPRTQENSLSFLQS